MFCEKSNHQLAEDKSLSDKTGSPQSDTVQPCLIYTEKLGTNQLNYIYQYNKMRASESNSNIF